MFLKTTLHWFENTVLLAITKMIFFRNILLFKFGKIAWWLSIKLRKRKPKKGSQFLQQLEKTNFFMAFEFLQKVHGHVYLIAWHWQEYQISKCFSWSILGSVDELCFGNNFQQFWFFQAISSYFKSHFDDEQLISKPDTGAQLGEKNM